MSWFRVQQPMFMELFARMNVPVGINISPGRLWLLRWQTILKGWNKWSWHFRGLLLAPLKLMGILSQASVEPTFHLKFSALVRGLFWKELPILAVCLLSSDTGIIFKCEGPELFDVCYNWSVNPVAGFSHPWQPYFTTFTECLVEILILMAYISGITYLESDLILKIL